MNRFFKIFMFSFFLSPLTFTCSVFAMGNSDIISRTQDVALEAVIKDAIKRHKLPQTIKFLLNEINYEFNGILKLFNTVDNVCSNCSCEDSNQIINELVQTITNTLSLPENEKRSIEALCLLSRIQCDYELRLFSDID